MRRFLVVGCGGSGGSALAYMMDQLRSDLAKVGVDRLPAGWQFVSLDVPITPEKGPNGLGNVRQQGGHYLGLGTQKGSYAELDDALSRRLAANDGLAALAPWAPRRPELETTPINVGAGQYRAVGRAILLTKAAEVKQALRDAWLTLAHADTVTEMERVARLREESFDTDPPLVLVVSSMAGGSGASMALDVCRLLTQVPNVNPNLIALFTFTPDVFDRLTPAARFGVRANALAMLGEVIASQTGTAQRHDVEILSALGQRDAAVTSVPFARVFPVGRSVGVEQAEFGDGSTDAVYRGLARGLAGLMVSDIAAQQFVSYDLGNRGSAPPLMKYLGWGAESREPLPWGSFGFASISMGRDRYAEYSAQRLARACVDRLLDGHLQQGSEASGHEQAQRLVDTQWARVCQDLQIPATLSGPNALVERDQWFRTQVLPAASVDSTADQVAEGAFRFERPDNEHWLEHVRRGMQAGRGRAVREADENAYRAAVTWQLALVQRTEQVLAEAVSRFGLTYAAVLLDRLASYVSSTLMPAVAGIGLSQVPDPTELPSQVVAAASARGAVRGNDQFFRAVLDSARQRLAQQMYIQAARHLGASLREFVTGALGPLREAVRQGYEVVADARAAQTAHDGLARLETDQYTAWPSSSDLAVPARFGEANNELMLTPSSEFAGQFAVDVRTTLDADETGPDSEAVVVQQVILGQWRSEATPPPGGLLIEASRWWPREFGLDPEGRQSVRAQDGRYILGVLPGQVRARAQQFVNRPNQSFSRFCEVTMRQFVEAPEQSARERERRWSELVSKFRRALSLAAPLVSVDAQAVRVLHSGEDGGQEVRYAYKFSAIPKFGRSSELHDVLRDNPLIARSGEDNFDEAVRKTTTDPQRIDIFGSYPLYSPLAFDSLLDPVVDQWDRVSPEGAEQFWHLRRARPLDASLPMTTAERQAMIAGWYIGQIIGELRIPEEPYSDPVLIWDAEESRWVGFPHPLLTPPRLFRGQFEWLPAVLESVLVAIARVHQAPILGSLRPYHLLRGLYDADDLGRQDGVGLHALTAERRLTTWLQRGSQSGLPSRVPSIAAATTPEERYEAAVAWLTGDTGPAFLAREHFLPPSLGGGGKGAYSVIKNRKKASQVPMFRDLAPDINWATGQVEALLARANRVRRPDVAGPDGDDGVALPDFGPL